MAIRNYCKKRRERKKQRARFDEIKEEFKRNKHLHDKYNEERTKAILEGRRRPVEEGKDLIVEHLDWQKELDNSYM